MHLLSATRRARSLTQADVACMAQINEPAKQLVAELGMRADQAASFAHPELAAGHPLHEQLLYRLLRGDWRQ